MSRTWQFFRTPDGHFLPSQPRWQVDDIIRVPKEHWNIIVSFSQKVDASMAKKLVFYSNLLFMEEENDCPKSLEEIQQVYSFLQELKSVILRSPPLLEFPTPEVPENLDNSEYIMMIDGIINVFRYTLKTKKMFDSWTE